MTLLRSIVLHGVETWALRKTVELRLAVFKSKGLRKIYYPVFDNETKESRKLHNDELQRQFQRSNIVKEIDKSRFMWAGHAWHKQGSLIKRVIEKEPLGKRPLRKPKLRWEDCLKKDVKTIGPEISWKEVAEE